jgi:hypothetical protein
MADYLLINTTYNERRNVVVRLLRSSLLDTATGAGYFSSTVAERHEESGADLDFFIRMPTAKGVSEVMIDDVGDLKSLQ